MAGTVFGLPLSQRIDSNGKPLIGWLIFLYTANSSTPVNSYQDTGLTVLNPWPLSADSNGTAPIFWVADGSYRVRATTSDGSIVLFDLPSVLAIGASAGSAPSGGVDPTAIFQTGDVVWLDVQGTRTGWVRDNGRTIGSATSGASERANSDCQALFQYLWNTYSNSLCAVSTGRGGSAGADWAANKTITLLDKRGYLVGGLDDMGNSAASRWTGAPVIAGSVTTAASTIGEVTHQLLQAELPNVSLSAAAITFSGTAHTWTSAHSYLSNNGSGLGFTVGGGFALEQVPIAVTPAGTIGGSISLGGSGTSHNVVQRTVLGTFFRKL